MMQLKKSGFYFNARGVQLDNEVTSPGLRAFTLMLQSLDFRHVDCHKEVTFRVKCTIRCAYIL